MIKTTPPKSAPTTAPSMTATTSIIPMGSRASDPRDHLIEVSVSAGGRLDDKSELATLARRSLDAFPPSPGWPDRRRFSGGEASVVCVGRPAEESMAELRSALAGAGCKVIIHEKRECSEPACSSEATMEWNRPAAVPRSWFASGICGKHNYRACPGCKSVYAVSSTNSAEHAPSVHCQVCGLVLMEWGGSKVWEMELVARGTAS